MSKHPPIRFDLTSGLKRPHGLSLFISCALLITLATILEVRPEVQKTSQFATSGK